jgi:hypothetical protein
MIFHSIELTHKIRMDHLPDNSNIPEGKPNDLDISEEFFARWNWLMRLKEKAIEKYLFLWMYEV